MDAPIPPAPAERAAPENVGSWPLLGRRGAAWVVVWTEAEFAALPHRPASARHYPAGVWADVLFR